MSIAAYTAPDLPPSVAATAGLVFDIRHYSVHDGPGIRTAVFFKGCPLSCWWCHNPEGRSPEPNLVLDGKRCLDCGECLAVCPEGATIREEGVIRTLPALCRVCGACAEACPAEARKVAGLWIAAPAVIAEIEKDVVFYDESGGGVTFSGGEPFAQPHFLEALLDGCAARRIHTVVDTCGFVDQSLLLPLSEKVDLFLYDLKILDPSKHREYTGVTNDSILENLEALARKQQPVVIRFPVIPGINDGGEDIRKMRKFLSHLGLRRIDLLPYHQIGLEKYRRVGMKYRLDQLQPPSIEHVQQIAAQFEREGFAVRIGG